ncbi:ArsR family transcriptional regulator [Candidatus Woesearchaeota archaeon]|nr:ArsR family transcriptional regulator [Candidatus Woesearchaeota archaeon]
MDFPEENLVRGLSASSRRQLLRLISEKQCSVKELATKTGQSVSLTSRHLKFLYDLGFLNVVKKFPYKYYSLKNTKIEQLLNNYQKTTAASFETTKNDDEENLARALGAESRRQLLRLIAEKQLSVKELAAKTGQSVSLASRHLKFLHDLGFLKLTKQFPYKYYSLKNKELESLLEQYNQVIKKT